MSLELDPPDRVGPLRIGMKIDEAERALGQIPGFVHLGSRSSNVPTRGRGEYESGLTVVALRGARDRVVGVEIFRPLVQFPVLLNGIDVFATHSEDVIEMLERSTLVIREDGGLLVIAPKLLVSLARSGVPESRDEDEDGAFFDSVLVAHPGYYDGPVAMGGEAVQ